MRRRLMEDAWPRIPARRGASISLGLAASALTAAGWAGEVRACRTYLPVETELVDPMFRRDEIEVVREALALTCDEDASGRWPEGALRCRVRARYRLRNHGVAPVVDEGLVVVHRGEGLVVLQGGVDISEAVDPAFRRRWAEEVLVGRFLLEPRGGFDVRVFEVTLAAGAAIEITTEAAVVIAFATAGCDESATLTRHGGSLSPTKAGRFELDSAEKNAAPPRAIDVDLPRRYKLTYGVAYLRRADFTRVRAGPDRRRMRSRRRPVEPRLRIIRDHELDAGGPFVAAGVDLGGGRPRPRLRVGWELPVPSHQWLQSLAFESDLEAMTVIPATEIASRARRWWPSVGLGLGAPLQIYPEVRAGVRGLLSLHWWGRFGVIGTFDAFPRRGAQAGLRGGLMLQLGL